MTAKKEDTSTEQVEERIRKAVAEGGDVAREVERISREALETGLLEFERMKSVIESIGRGASAGAGAEPDQARHAIGEAFEGLQNALLQSFDSARLAAEEQAARMEDYYENELKVRLHELRHMETTMLDSLAQAARAGSDAGAAALDDIVRHARRSGTRLGGEVERSMRTLSKSLPEALRETARAGFGAAREASAYAAEVASGVLSGIASVLHDKKGGKPARKKTHADDRGDRGQS